MHDDVVCAGFDAAGDLNSRAFGVLIDEGEAPVSCVERLDLRDVLPLCDGYDCMPLCLKVTKLIDPCVICVDAYQLPTSSSAKFVKHRSAEVPHTELYHRP